MDGNLDGYLDRHLDRTGLCRFGRWRVRRELVFLLVAPTVGAFLTVLAQVDFAVLAADHRPVALAAVPVTSFTVIAVGDVPGAYLDPLVALEALLAVELQITADTLQTPTLITFKGSLLRATTGITLLTY